jgi:hypothetical protein
MPAQVKAHHRIPRLHEFLPQARMPGHMFSQSVNERHDGLRLAIRLPSLVMEPKTAPILAANLQDPHFSLPHP